MSPAHKKPDHAQMLNNCYKAHIKVYTLLSALITAGTPHIFHNAMFLYDGLLVLGIALLHKGVDRWYL